MHGALRKPNHEIHGNVLAVYSVYSVVKQNNNKQEREKQMSRYKKYKKGFPLAGRPLPDHRTYGLVGRSLWQSPITYTAARLFRPVFLSQQNKTKCTGKVLGWQCSCQIAVCTDMPRSLAGRGQWSGQNIRESCFAQISQFGLGQFPLFPVLYAIGPRFCLRLPSHEPSLTRSLVAA